jgi:hypothetical protein
VTRFARPVLVALALLALGACTGDDEVPTERGDGGTLPAADPDAMTPAEHADAACAEVAEVRSGAGRVHGDQLDYIISHAGAADDDALDEAANDWAHGIEDSDRSAVADADRRLDELCN